MPNHITNSVTISHEDPKKIEWLKGCFIKSEEGDGQTLDFDKIIPQPKNIFQGNLGDKERAECEKDGRPNWYDWNIENWGTKWGAYDGQIVAEKKKLIACTFLTAWAPPEPIFEKLEEMGFSVNGYWYDDGEMKPHLIGEGGEWYPRCEVEYGG